MIKKILFLTIFSKKKYHKLLLYKKISVYLILQEVFTSLSKEIKKEDNMKPISTFIAAVAALGISCTWAESVKEFHVFLPQNSTWKGSVPMIYEDGKSRELTIDSEHCGWYYRRYVDEALPKKVFIYRDDDAAMNELIGMNGSWEDRENVTPISMDAMFDLYSTDPNFNGAVYFVADAEEASKLPSVDVGWFVNRPDVIGTCSFNLATIIYDTDASLHGAFSCTPEWHSGQTEDETKANDCYSATAKFPVVTSASAEMPCIGMTQGMVESTLELGENKKMKLTAKGKQCFGAQADSAFAAMFKHTEGVNEVSCQDIPFTQTTDGKYEFNSDYYTNPGTTVPGGFYPVEAPNNATMMSEKLPAARTKRNADAPQFFCTDETPNSKTPLGLRTIDEKEGVAKSNLICNGPGWNGGVNCEGFFAKGSEFVLGGDAIAKQISQALDVTWSGDGWGWSCPNEAPEGWTTFNSEIEKRNHHFCTESHGKFRYRKGLKLSVSGNDDIWVFVDNKLAIDIGGTHLAAPGHVDMDKFLTDAENGKFYDIDIFTCNRRAASSDLSIKANFTFFETGTTGISITSKSNMEDYIRNGNNHFKICRIKSGGSSCAAALHGSTDSENCGPHISEKITYVFSTDKTGQDATKIMIKESEFEKNPIQYNGGIDVSTPYDPIINEEILQQVLPSGKYYFIVKIGNDSKAIEINVKGNSGISIANREAVIVEENGNIGSTHEFKNQIMVSSPLSNGMPDITQLVPLYIADIIDPCSSSNCTDPLEMKRSPASSYSLQVSSDKVMFYEKKNGSLVAFNPNTTRKINNNGIDTIYATIPISEMETTKEKVSINVKGSSRKAEITFFVPHFVFVDANDTYNIIMTDKDSEPRIKGGVYAFYIVALNADDTPCTDCNFPISLGSKTSIGLNIVASTKVVNGRAVITLVSSVTYEKCTDNSCRGPATLQIVGPSPTLMQATYGNMQFKEGTISTPQETIKKSPFLVQAVAPQELSISTDNFTSGQAKRFAVMDMKGQVISAGELNGAETRVKVPVSGSYIVKVGTQHKRVNIK